MVTVPVFLKVTKPLSSTVAITLPWVKTEELFTEYTTPMCNRTGVVTALSWQVVPLATVVSIWDLLVIWVPLGRKLA